MKKFLIVVDMQKDFVNGALGTNEAVSIVPKVAEKIESFCGEIIVTYDTHGDDYLSTPEGQKLPVPHCIKGTEGFELNEDIKSALSRRSYTTVEKPTFGSVALPQIIANLSQGDEFSLELVGLCTDICVVSNALILKAHFPDATISVDALCCAGVTPESHKAALLTMRMCQIDVVNE